MMLLIVAGVATNFAGKYCHAAYNFHKYNCNVTLDKIKIPRKTGDLILL